MASSNTSPKTSATPRALTPLRAMAVITAVAAAIQAILGLYLRTSPAFHAHTAVAGIALVASVVAAVAAGRWARASGNRGLAGHAVSLPLLAVAQWALGELGVTMIHIVVGLLFLLDAVALVTLVYRKPGRVAR